jgi:hypothetical protein
MSVSSIDRSAIHAHVELIHSLAASLTERGKLVIAAFAEDPDQVDPKTGKLGLPLRPILAHVEIGELEKSLRIIADLTVRPRYNVYMPLAVHRHDLRPGGKGYEKDVVAVLGLVSDFDDEDAPRWAERLPISPNYVIETSLDRFQAFYLFDRPCSVAKAKPIAVRLKDFARCDHGTIDLSHVWRIPGALNWPNVKKIAGGRPREPQVARVVLPWNGTRTALSDLAAALPGQLRELDASDRSNGTTGPMQRFAEPVGSAEMISLLVKALPDNLQKLIAEPSDDRSKAIFSTVKELNKRGFDRAVIRRIIEVHPRGIGAKHVGRNDLDRDLDRILSKLSKPSRTEAVQQVRMERGSLNRPIVKVIGGDLVEVINQAERYLVTADGALFQRGDFIVRPAPVIIEIADGRQVTGLRLVTVRHHHLVERFTEVVDFVRFDARSKEWVSINCPAQIAQAYLERIGHWRLPHLTGLTTCPTLRPDGSILDAPGYDHLTGIFFDPRGVTFPPIPQLPTREDALAALVELKQLIHEFPFVPDDASSPDPDEESGSRSVVLSLFLTAIVRKSLRAAPLHAFSASDAGSGKTKLVNTASILATGHEAPAMNSGANEEEFEKRLACHLLAGDALINIDNCERPISSEKLCSVLTERSTSIRILGNNEDSPRVVNTALITINGNNLAIVGDLTRRALRCDLNPGVERPELREFATEDPVVTAKRERPRLVVAALTVLRAFHVAGRPSATVPLGSFEDWSTWIRDALIWLGEPDPCATMEKIRTEDPRRRALASVLRHWRAVFGADEVTVQQLIGRATDLLPVNSQELQRREFAFPEFREALLEIAGQGGVISGKRVGNWLRVVKGRIVDGMRIESGLREGYWRLR